jgi:hypothetical protein
MRNGKTLMKSRMERFEEKERLNKQNNGENAKAKRRKEL